MMMGHLEISPDGRIGRTKSVDVSWHDHLSLLLHVAAEIEHVLMVQYLYAGYSIDSRRVPPQHRGMIDRWRQTILDIAKEEMGHLLCVQNVLMLVGAPVNLGRRSFPWDLDYFPFPFRLEPLSLDALTLYVYAEMPSDDVLEEMRARGDLAEAHYREFLKPEVFDPFQARVQALTGGRAHHVDELYNSVIDLLRDEDRIPDAVFREDSYVHQATWDDWGRRYRPAPRMLTPDGSLDPAAPPDPDAATRTSVLVLPVATRTEALAALALVSEQGEAPHLGRGKLGEESHFDRFLKIYLEMLRHPDLDPALPVPTNPTTRDSADPSRHVSAVQTRPWAALFNLRYRMLLAYLAHALRTAQMPGRGTGTPGLRAMLMHKVFGEMYGIKALSARLMRMPLTDAPGDPARAGPPFELPYDLTLPYRGVNVWRLHLELARGAQQLNRRIRATASGDAAAYLDSQHALDGQTIDWIEGILAGLAPGERV